MNWEVYFVPGLPQQTDSKTSPCRLHAAFRGLRVGNNCIPEPCCKLAILGVSSTSGLFLKKSLESWWTRSMELPYLLANRVKELNKNMIILDAARQAKNFRCRVETIESNTFPTPFLYIVYTISKGAKSVHKSVHISGAADFCRIVDFETTVRRSPQQPWNCPWDFTSAQWPIHLTLQLLLESHRQQS